MRNEPNAAIELAHVAPFRLAGVEVEPASRMVRSPAGEAEVQPRVMQVLVALAKAGGTVLSHDDLIAQCWGGRVVGENAIHRAISRIRDVASEIGSGSFEVVTVKGVGYRLRTDGTANREEQPFGEDDAPGHSRRTLLVSGGIAAAAAIMGAAAWRAWPTSDVSALARDHVAHAESLIRSSTASDSNDQALRQYRAAVADSPDYARAWAGLAFAQLRRMDEAPDAQVNAVAAEAIDAARRALEIDEGNLRARAALLLVQPQFGRWDEVRARLERLDDGDPKTWEIAMEVASLHRSTGDFASAIPIYERLLRADASNLQAHRALVRSYWRAGRVPQLEALLATAERQWPRDHSTWSAAFNYLVMTGRYDRARLLLDDQARYPADLAPQAIRVRQAVLRAVESNGEEARGKAVDLVMSYRNWGPQSYHSMASVLALLQVKDLLLELLQGYYRGTGEFARHHARYSRRATGFLFTPFFDPVRRDPDFRAFMSGLGLRPDPRV